MTVENDLIDGLANLIAAAGLATYNPSGIYTDAQTGIFDSAFPPSPGRIVTLTAVPLTDDPSLPMSQILVQARCRGTQDPRDVANLAGGIFDILHGLTHVQFGSAHVIQCFRRTSAPLGADANKRWSRSDQYYIDVDTPPTLLRPTGGTF